MPLLVTYDPTNFVNPVSNAAESDGRVIKNIEIFRAGTFRDSSGELQSWTIEQLNQMVQNFYLLAATDKLPNVPVRLDHTRSIKDVVGYITDLRVDGTKLKADIEFTDPQASSMYSAGTLRSRSIEIRAYEDNTQVTHWPVVAGLAFVDLPAVEGLHALGGMPTNSYRFDEEGDVPATDTNASAFKFTLPTGETSDHGAVLNYMKGLEAEVASLSASVFTLTSENRDLASENEAMKSALAEVASTTRANFVKGLADAKKIAAPQVEPMTKLVVSLDDEQFAAFAATYDTAPVLPILADHGATVSNPNGETGFDAKAQKIADFGAVIENLRKAGMSDDEIARTNTFKQLTALKTGA